MLAPEAEAAAAVPHGRPVSLHSLSGCFLVCGGSDFWAHAVWKSHQEVLAFILSTVSAALAARVAEIARPFRRLKALLLGPGGGRASCGPARTPPPPPACPRWKSRRWRRAPCHSSGSLCRLQLLIVKHTLGFCSLPLIRPNYQFRQQCSQQKALGQLRLKLHNWMRGTIKIRWLWKKMKERKATLSG